MQMHVHFLMGSRKRGIDFIIVPRLLPQVGINPQLCLQTGKRKTLSITELLLGKDQTLMNITEFQSAVFAFLQCRQPSTDMAVSKVKVPSQNLSSVIPEAWRAGSLVESVYWSCRGPQFASQHQQGSSQPILTPVQGHQCPPQAFTNSCMYVIPTMHSGTGAHTYTQNKIMTTFKNIFYFLPHFSFLLTEDWTQSLVVCLACALPVIYRRSPKRQDF